MTPFERDRPSAAAAMAARLRKLLDLPVYPVLIAAYSPLHLMADNLSLFPAADVVRPVAVLVAVTLVALVLLGAVLRDRHRAALWTALAVGFICFFFLLQQFFDITTKTALGLSFPGNIRFGGLLALFAIVGVLARPGATFTKFANVAIAATLAVPFLTLARDELALSRAMAGVEASAEMQRNALFGAVRAGETKPSIIHIVLDGYSREDVLRDLYGFDNSPFIDALRARGFAIADAATTPYSQTLLVMNSVLSAQYLQVTVPDRPADADLFRQILTGRLARNPVMRTLSGMGYQTAATDVDYSPVRLDRVDRFFGSRGLALTNFEKAAYGRTAIAHIDRQLGGGGTGETIRNVFARPHHRYLEAPFFLYLHVIGPHPPFDVDLHGNPVDPAKYHNVADGNPRIQEDPALRAAYRAGYLEKLRFVNDQVLGYVDRVLAEVPGPKVIILHGDHGGSLYLDQEDAAATCFRERFSPLLAVYSSGGRLQRTLPADLNLVNLYRLVFNALFEAELPLLPAQSVFASWSRPDRFEALSPARVREPCATAPVAGMAPGEAAEGADADPLIRRGRPPT